MIRLRKGNKRLYKMAAILCLLAAFLQLNGEIIGKAESSPESAGENFPPFKENNPNRKVAYLTFDDGPSSNTIPILDILDKYGIKATFFVMADESEEAKEGYLEMIKRGHTIALHTYSHDYKEIYVSPEAFFRNIEKLETFLWDNYKIKTDILRFPGGSKNRSSKIYGGPQIMESIKKECRERGYKYYDWNIDTTDGISPAVSSYTIESKALAAAKNNKEAIILMHDIGLMDNTVTALPKIIEGLQKQGFEFDVIGDQTKEMHF